MVTVAAMPLKMVIAVEITGDPLGLTVNIVVGFAN